MRAQHKDKAPELVGALVKGHIPVYVSCWSCWFAPSADKARPPTPGIHLTIYSKRRIHQASVSILGAILLAVVSENVIEFSLLRNCHEWHISRIWTVKLQNAKVLLQIVKACVYKTGNSNFGAIYDSSNHYISFETTEG